MKPMDGFRLGDEGEACSLCVALAVSATLAAGESDAFMAHDGGRRGELVALTGRRTALCAEHYTYAEQFYANQHWRKE
jgi:hypothetical protein